MRLLIVLTLFLASCQEYKSPETIKLERELDSIHSEVNKTKLELIELQLNGSTKR